MNSDLRIFQSATQTFLLRQSISGRQFLCLGIKSLIVFLTMFWLMGVRSVNFSIKTGVGEPQSFFLVEVARQTTIATNTPSPP